IVRLLVTYGADVNRTGRTGYTPLGFAVVRRDSRLAALLLKAGADPQIRDPTGRLPLRRAVAAGHAEFAAALPAAGGAATGRKRARARRWHTARRSGTPGTHRPHAHAADIGCAGRRGGPGGQSAALLGNCAPANRGGAASDRPRRRCAKKSCRRQHGALCARG